MSTQPLHTIEFPDRAPVAESVSAHEPVVPASVVMPELTLPSLLVGTILGVIFGASSLYLVLKVGLTVSASIPVAVISIAFFRMLRGFGLRDATILEHNITQTAGSAGESIAFGIGATMPAIMILGFDLEITRIMLVATLGGLLGILMMIPLRRALIVQQHGVLKYPEGTACAEVLKSGTGAAAAAAGAGAIISGFAIGLVYKAAMVSFKAWKEVPEKIVSGVYKGAWLNMEVSPELLGVGYIIGPRISALMCAGGVLSYLIIIPMIRFFGDGMAAVLAPGTMPVGQMTVEQIQRSYVLYIGAGAVAAGGIISLARSLPMIARGLRAGLRNVRGSAGRAASASRLERDLPVKFVLIGSLALVAIIAAARPLHMNVVGALLIVILGFLFVTVSSRLTGEVGSSSNPISGMAIATLLLTCLVFLVVGWTGPAYYVTALSVGAIVCIAASQGGTTSQDLKTGFLVGATPRHQQVAIIVGTLTSALLLGPILLRLNDAATVLVPVTTNVRVATRDLPREGQYFAWHTEAASGLEQGKYLVDDGGRPRFLVDPGINGSHTTRQDGTVVTKFAAPKATLMSYVIKGILNHRLPWTLVLFGVMIAVMLEMAGVPSLAFAVGVYLPFSTSTAVFAGGVVRWLADLYHRRKHAESDLTPEEIAAEAERSPGTLLASGFIAGGALAGIINAFMAGVMAPLTDRIAHWSSAHNPFFEGARADALALVPFAVLVILLTLAGCERIFARD
ncbi:MAG TPA: oligopeptide transporter, OPT family [Thermoanaerobaculia bacterium]|nr:oligopeptide transporter, OPT family [Thermoanaerobaculia bacterium]